MFNTGRFCWTRGVNDKVANDENFAKFVMDSMKRHVRGDWGDLNEEDKQENEFSLKNNFRLFSSYGLNSEKIWIITGADRSATTVLFPSEY